MTQTAAALSTDHALNNQWPSARTLSINTAIGKLDVADEVKRVIETTALDGTFYKSTSQLHYGDKVKFSFAVRDSYQAHFILMKGLLEFHRARRFVFSFNKLEQTFDVTTDSTAISQPAEELNNFLKKVAAWLDQELSFKRQLKEMMAFEREYRAKLAKVYAGGDGFTLLRVS